MGEWVKKIKRMRNTAKTVMMQEMQRYAIWKLNRKQLAEDAANPSNQQVRNERYHKLELLRVEFHTSM